MTLIFFCQTCTSLQKCRLPIPRFQISLGSRCNQGLADLSKTNILPGSVAMAWKWTQARWSLFSITPLVRVITTPLYLTTTSNSNLQTLSSIRPKVRYSYYTRVIPVYFFFIRSSDFYFLFAMHANFFFLHFPVCY